MTFKPRWDSGSFATTAKSDISGYSIFQIQILPQLSPLLCWFLREMILNTTSRSLFGKWITKLFVVCFCFLHCVTCSQKDPSTLEQSKGNGNKDKMHRTNQLQDSKAEHPWLHFSFLYTVSLLKCIVIMCFRKFACKVCKATLPA